MARILGIFLAMACASSAFSQTLNLPPRPAAALSGTEIIAALTPLSVTQREKVIHSQIAQGNIPNFLRTLRPITVTASIAGTNHTATYHVTPDYMALGSDEDYFLTPMTPVIAQQLADRLDCTLPTRKMVNQIWTNATVKLSPSTIPPSAAMTTVPVFAQHNAAVRAQRSATTHAFPLGALVGGTKKDVVISLRIYTNFANANITRPVVIYGWHYTNGTPIQPLYNGHGETYADYSHGIRLVRNSITLNGAPATVAQVLSNANLSALLSDEGAVAVPRYPVAQTAQELSD